MPPAGWGLKGGGGVSICLPHPKWGCVSGGGQAMHCPWLVPHHSRAEGWTRGGSDPPPDPLGWGGVSRVRWGAGGGMRWRGEVQRAVCIRNRGPRRGPVCACGVQGCRRGGHPCRSVPISAWHRGPLAMACPMPGPDVPWGGGVAVGKGRGLGALLPPPPPPPLAPPLLLVPLLLLLPLLLRLLLGFALLLHCQAQLLQFALQHGTVLRAAHAQSLPAQRVLPQGARGPPPPNPALGSGPPALHTSPVRGLEASLSGCLKLVLPSAPWSSCDVPSDVQ